MDEFFVFMQVKGVEFFFDEVFDCFHVVVGDFFDVFDALRIVDSEIEVDFLKIVK